MPTSVDKLTEAVWRVAEDGLKVAAVGGGHSFTSIAATNGALLHAPGQ
jgi:L-gulonolactone oxidase